MAALIVPLPVPMGSLASVFSEIALSDIITLLLVIVGAAATWQLARRKELQEAFRTRGEMIEDRDRMIAEYQHKCDEMDKRVASLEGQMKFAQSIKSKEISMEVIAGISHMLRGEQLNGDTWADLPKGMEP